MPREFIPLRIAILTVSDTRQAGTDVSGDMLVQLLSAAGHVLADRRIVADERDIIAGQVAAWIADAGVDVVIATGGTGLTGRDVTPEAFEPLYEKAIPGFGELFRAQGFAKIGLAALQSRATAGLANGTYLFALPGSPGACRDAWSGILQELLDNRSASCTLVTLLPRLQER